jgi:hypothetical protein
MIDPLPGRLQENTFEVICSAKTRTMAIASMGRILTEYLIRIPLHWRRAPKWTSYSVGGCLTSRGGPRLSLPSLRQITMHWEELARRLAVPTSWIRDQVRSRSQDPLPHVTLGKYVRFLWGSPALEPWMRRRIVVGNNRRVERVR